MPSKHVPFDTLALAIAALSVLACSPEDRADVDTAADTVGARIGAAADTVAGRVAGREYTNAELTGFLNAFNDAEVEVGQLASEKATDAQVRSFARRIVTEHRALKAEVTSAAQGLNLTPAVPDDDEDLREDHAEGMRQLRDRARGREWDEAFLEHEVAMHRKMIDEIDDSLGRARNQELRALLERARTGLQAHLTTAEELEGRLGT